MNVDHLGIAVPDLAAGLASWGPLLTGIPPPVEEVPSQRVRVAFLEFGGTHLELLEPTSPDSAVGRFLSSRGPGLHHIAFSVPSVNDALAAAAARGQRLIDQSARVGARGRKVGFVHPSGFQGVLVEFVEAP
ncbi:MAG: VOC family protein [Thermoplasmata archaeon]|nr:VOC family protein [Thermoplasmata archaeon]